VCCLFNVPLASLPLHATATQAPIAGLAAIVTESATHRQGRGAFGQLFVQRFERGALRQWVQCCEQGADGTGREQHNGSTQNIAKRTLQTPNTGVRKQQQRPQRANCALRCAMASLVWQPGRRVMPRLVVCGRWGGNSCSSLVVARLVAAACRRLVRRSCGRAFDPRTGCPADTFRKGGSVRDNHATAGCTAAGKRLFATNRDSRLTCTRCTWSTGALLLPTTARQLLPLNNAPKTSKPSHLQVVHLVLQDARLPHITTAHILSRQKTCPASQKKPTCR